MLASGPAPRPETGFSSRSDPVAPDDLGVECAQSLLEVALDGRFCAGRFGVRLECPVDGLEVRLQADAAEGRPGGRRVPRRGPPPPPPPVRRAILSPSTLTPGSRV